MWTDLAAGSRSSHRCRWMFRAPLRDGPVVAAPMGGEREADPRSGCQAANPAAMPRRSSPPPHHPVGEREM
jgi:hypothetical protein